jgi:ergothioneine biosynthesis protein EgtB
LARAGTEGRSPLGHRAAELALRYRQTRAFTEELCRPLEPDDYVAQSMPDASPAKWHLAHTTWFFETFVLRALEGYERLEPLYEVLFNSYYNSVGEQHPRPQRGLLTRPTVEGVYGYRRHVDAATLDALEGDRLRAELDVVELGLQHEQQHQELLLTDLKHLFSLNPLRPAYRSPAPEARWAAPPLAWHAHGGGLREIGKDPATPGLAPGVFAFDNEGPRHRVYLQPFALASRPVTNAEYLQFVADGGYTRPALWLAEGWDAARALGWQAPLYWERNGDGWWTFTLSGLRPLAPAEPVCHISYYEADAFARWSGARLPREAEWETAAAETEIAGNFAESGRFHPAPAGSERSPAQIFGDVWEWTQSPYVPYPGYRPPTGALGEYNGKFMCNQMVLRGGSCATPGSHVRPTYRNFFPPAARWQFSGLRLARDP